MAKHGGPQSAAARALIRRYFEAINQLGIKDADGKWLVGPGDLVAVVGWIERIGTSDGLGGFVVPANIAWSQLWAAALSVGAPADGDPESRESFFFDLSRSDTQPLCLPARANTNANGRHPTGTELYHVQRAYRLVRDVRGTLTEAEISAGGAEHHVPAEAMSHLRRAAGLPDASAPSNASPNELPDELVTLSQVAPLTGRTKRTLERYLKSGQIPQPDIPGEHGKPHRWYWRTLRPALSQMGLRIIPERFPASKLL